MAQSPALIKTLKVALKTRGLTYRDVARGIGLSEASVKRLFASENLSLARFDEICQLIDCDISDIVRLMDSENRKMTELSDAQEQELVSDTKLLLVAFLVVNGWLFEEIIRFYNFSVTELIQQLAKLDSLKLIELLPGNRIKLLISANFAWRKNGPIQQFFTNHLQDEFFKARFEKRGESFKFLSGMLSRSSSDLLIKKMEQLAIEFNELNRQDANLSLGDRIGSSMILAMRSWRPSAFERYRRDEK